MAREIDEAIVDIAYIKKDVDRLNTDQLNLRRDHSELRAAHHSHETYAQENGTRLFKLMQAMKALCDKIGVDLPKDFFSGSL